MTEFFKRQAAFDAVAALAALGKELNPYESERDIIEDNICNFEYLMKDTKKAVNDICNQLSDITLENIDNMKIIDLVNDAYELIVHLEGL